MVAKKVQKDILLKMAWFRKLVRERSVLGLNLLTQSLHIFWALQVNFSCNFLRLSLLRSYVRAIYWQYRDNNINRTHRALTYIDINWLMQGHCRGIKGRICIFNTEASELLKMLDLSLFYNSWVSKQCLVFQKCLFQCVQSSTSSQQRKNYK